MRWRHVSSRLRRSPPALITSVRVRLFTVTLIVAIFFVDLSTPLGLAIPVLYVLPVVCLAMWSSPHATVSLFVTAIVCTLLGFFGLLLSPPGDRELAIGNRALSLCAVWGTILLALLKKGLDQDCELHAERRREEAGARHL
jgi:hypothetical protein